MFIILSLLASVTAPLTDGKDVVSAKPPKRLPDGSYEDCPCLEFNDRILADKLSTAALKISHLESFQEANVYAPNINFTHYLLYNGHECGRHWEQIDPQCWVRFPPRHCHAKWCYVDPESCSDRRSAAPTTGYQTPNFYYSVATCGSSPSLIVHKNFQLVGKDLVLYSSGLEITAFTYKVGAVPTAMIATRFAAELFRRLGIRNKNIFYRNISDHALAFGKPSTYTACVWDVAVGNLDMCIMDLWDTEFRRSISPDAVFSGQMTVEKIYMYVIPDLYLPTESVWDKIVKPLAPFSVGLWFTLFGGVIFYAFSMYLFDAERHDVDCRTRSEHMCQHIYYAIISFLGASVISPGRTPEGKIVSLGFGLFIIIAIGTFTANTATFLLQGASVDKITVEDVIADGVSVCVHPVLLQAVEHTIPELKNSGRVVLTDEFNSFDKLNSKECEAMLISDMQVRYEWAKGEHCDVVSIGSPVAVFPMGFWIRAEHQTLFGVHMSQMRFDGSWSRVEENLLPPGSCKVADTSVNRLEAQHMLGSILLLVFFFAVSLCTHFRTNVLHIPCKHMGKLPVPVREDVLDAHRNDDVSPRNEPTPQAGEAELEAQRNNVTNEG